MVHDLLQQAELRKGDDVVLRRPTAVRFFFEKTCTSHLLIESEYFNGDHFDARDTNSGAQMSDHACRHEPGCRS